MYEALTLPSAFPPSGHDVNKAYRTHSEDLSAQKVGPFVPAEKKGRLGYIERQSENIQKHVTGRRNGYRNRCSDRDARALGDRDVQIRGAGIYPSTAHGGRVSAHLADSCPRFAKEKPITIN